MTLRYTLRQLEYFVAVGTYGSIAAASARVNVSSPSISAAVAQLEEEFGLSLFVRKHAQGLSLTKAGVRMMEQSQKILREADLLNNMAGEISGNVQGPMAIGCLATFAQFVMPKVRRAFEGKYPDVRITQFEMNQTEIFSHIRRAALDIALSYDLDIPADLTFVPLVELPPYVLVGEDHPLAEKAELTVQQLRDHDMVLLDLPMSGEYFLSFFTKAGIKPQIAERTRDMAVMRSLVANGYGYSIANVRPLSSQSPDGERLVFIPLVGDVRQMRMGLVMARGADSTSTAKAFIAHCREQISANGVPGIRIGRRGDDIGNGAAMQDATDA
ncbi:LysR family transcriptional regulator [Pseudophaeobacter sp.]|uniref:LysR family transcriptional regulator n=1 Tax=Pseudophaeobacter sp. TaxID=1971739 RepID=UPI0032977A68